jgi:hypothetical protein
MSKKSIIICDIIDFLAVGEHAERFHERRKTA